MKARTRDDMEADPLDQMQAWAREAVSDPEYLASVRRRLLVGSLPPKLESLLLGLALELLFSETNKKAT